MEQRNLIEKAVSACLDGTRANDLSNVPLTNDVVMKGPMIPEALHGESAVREHLETTAPFVARLDLVDLLIDGDRATMIVEFEGVNGVIFEGCQYLRFRDGAICEERVFYDTAILMRGRQS